MGQGIGRYQLWDVATGALQQTLKGYSGWVNSVAFSPDGKLVASGSENRTVQLWDVATGRCNRRTRATQAHLGQQPSPPTARPLTCVINILWLPPDYRMTSIASRNRSGLLGHLSGNISFLKFTQELKLI
jgi:WD40 repeat protein